ncbi:hypothetical protein V865_003066 [Kwoniella europaea PYCC6329]|uniref:Uncharacterized protein n=1 Tax=Kwoniella europaea PYCC6329 TaxID=1423913 RepID=A0AAX4KHH6_9TREE
MDSNSTDDPQAWYPTTAAILANINSSSIQSLFDQLSITGSTTTVKLHLLDGGVKNYTVDYAQAVMNGSQVMGDDNVGWPAVLRSAIIQHNTPGRLLIDGTYGMIFVPINSLSSSVRLNKGTIDLYDPNPEVGRRVYNWDDIVKDF